MLQFLRASKFHPKLVDCLSDYGREKLMADLRSLDSATQDKLETAVVATAKRAADEEGVTFRMERRAVGDYSKARPPTERLNDPVVQTALATANYFRKAKFLLSLAVALTSHE